MAVTQRKRPRPGLAAAEGEVLKLHRHLITADGHAYTAVTLRPGTDVRFSTNRFHDTWHVLSDWRGARVLARLLWGLAFQRKHGTLIVIDRRFLDPNPFDAGAADPIALVPAHLTVLRPQAAHSIRRHFLRPQPSHGTVRWRSHGLVQAIAERLDWQALPLGQRDYPHVPQPSWWNVDRIGGLVTFAASPATLRNWAIEVATMGRWSSYGMAYTESQWPHGEFQIFRQYRSEVSIARQARAEVLAGATQWPTPESLERRIWCHAETVRRRRLPAPVS